MTDWPGVTTWGSQTPMPPSEFQKMSNALLHLKEQLDALNGTVSGMAPSPIQRVGTYDSVTDTWSTGVAYETTKIVVYLNGAVRERGTGTGVNDWYEFDVATGKIKFNFATTATDQVDVLDWSA